MNYDIMINYDKHLYKDKETGSFITSLEEKTYLKIAYAVDSLVKYEDKVSLKNIKIITDIPTRDLEDFIDFILSAESSAILKYKNL